MFIAGADMFMTSMGEVLPLAGWQALFPTPAETERQAQILPALRTYSAGLMPALVMGRRSLNNMNAKICPGE